MSETSTQLITLDELSEGDPDELMEMCSPCPAPETGGEGIPRAVLALEGVPGRARPFRTKARITATVGTASSVSGNVVVKDEVREVGAGVWLGLACLKRRDGLHLACFFGIARPV